jgi:hypothetical protein
MVHVYLTSTILSAILALVIHGLIRIRRERRVRDHLKAWWEQIE